MPELPEMEHYKKMLKTHLQNKKITVVEIEREKSINVPAREFISLVRNQTIKDVSRRAKHLLFHLNNDVVLILHLMLGGWMFFGKEEEQPDRSIQIRLSFLNNHLYFIGLRLGYLHLYRGLDKAVEELKALGAEPLSSDLTEHRFLEMVSKGRGSLKTTLVNQSFLSGIGNCY
ncbi:DNA-formamidopyrimidine glycosylase family protein [Rossellomorea aquimaris]|uniref:DNA-formamidopyrimidine glycosylase family protein n=1 Tax=Rossellomorea TaxID=2837508 RepID=UPI00292A432D|nr:DNA-formamidopyrimidine glycosylase family protein [Rossellomorea vietnamensis]